MKHTVFTPVYNRKKDMLDLYQRMLSIDYPRDQWEWLIIDDGSTDGLKDAVADIINEKTINIRYIKKRGGGIHTAQNRAIREAKGQYITRIDSDDYLLPDSLKKYDKRLEDSDVDNDTSLAGVVGMCLNKSDMSPRSSLFPQDKIISTGTEQRLAGAKGDRNFCMKTVVMKEFLIPEFEDTNWVPELNYLWIPLDRKYKTVFVNEAISVCSEPNPGSVSGQIKEKSVSSMMSMFYSACGTVNNSDLHNAKDVIRAYVTIAYYAFKVKKQTKENKLQKGFKLMRGISQKTLLMLSLPIGYCLSVIK